MDMELFIMFVLLGCGLASPVLVIISFKERERLEQERRKKEVLASAWDIPQCKIDAPKGNPEAQYLLGRAYLESIGVQYDEAEGLYWLEQAAAQGHKEAYKYIHNRQSGMAAARAQYAMDMQMRRDFEQKFEARQREERLANEARERDRKLADDIARKIRKGY